MKIISICGCIALMAALPVSANADQQATRSSGGETWTGTLIGVNVRNGTFTGRHLLFTSTFYLGSNCAISTVDKKEATLGDLRPGEKVKVHYQNAEGVLVAERIAERPLHYAGRVHLINQKGDQVTMDQAALYQPFRAPQQFRVASDCRVILWNGHEGTLADVQPGDRISCIYELPGGSPVAYRIRDWDRAEVGKIEAVDTSARTVKVKGASGETHFALADHCRIVLAGKKTGELKNLMAGQQYQFTYEEVHGVNVLDRIGPAQTTKPTQTASRM